MTEGTATPLTAAAILPGSGAAEEIVFHPESLTDLLDAEISPVQWLVQDLIPMASCVLLAAEPKLGKTWVALDLALALAYGLPLYGRFSVPRPMRTLLVLNEDGRGNVAQRFRSLMRGRGIVPTPQNTDRVRIVSRRAFSLEHSQYLVELERYVVQERMDLVVLDPFTEMFTGDERHERDVKDALQPLKRLRDNTGASVFLTHHQRKPGENANSGRRAMAIRGSSYFVGWYDVGLGFASGSPNEPVKVHAEAREVELPVSEFSLIRMSDPERGVWFEYSDELTPTQGEKEAEERVLSFIAANPGANTRGIEKDCGGKEAMNRAARKCLVESRRLVTLRGPKNSTLHMLTRAEEVQRGLDYSRPWGMRLFSLWMRSGGREYDTAKLYSGK